ncbi:hypothetical protein ACCO45_007367 [Purpureocillium lilacinum]|uniref:Uncharacterized protein n=1 Tax=Purpureocillium lilacinum TaxID=33203 RepID=A0ACC4DS67_PURLI
MLSWFIKNHRVVVINDGALGHDPRGERKRSTRLRKRRPWAVYYSPETTDVDSSSTSEEGSEDVGSATKSKAGEGDNKHDGE